MSKDKINPGKQASRRGKYTGQAHGKIILIGEHSVVHFKPAIALPLMSTCMEAAVEANGSLSSAPNFSIDCKYFSGNLADAPGNLSNVKSLVAILSQQLCRPQGLGGFNIDISSSIPQERGMGSSAAVAVALIRAIADYAGVVLADQEIFDYTQISENIAHGNASGLDSIATAHDKAVWFERGQELKVFDCQCPGTLLVADTGIKGGTRQAVDDVRALLYSQERGLARKAAEDIDRLGQLTEEAAQALSGGYMRKLGYILDEAQDTLSALTVSSPELDRLIDAARQAGALGAKLTGGGRGGCMIALVPDDDPGSTLLSVVENALRAAGARRTWRLPLHG